MTRRERLERKLEKRRLWKESREQKATEHFRKADEAIDGIPFGQPILVGHHSEGKHRRAIERCHANGFAGVADLKMAENHASKAAGISEHLASSVFSDDHDAIEQLEQRIKENTEKADKYVEINKAWRKCKGDVAAMVATGLVGQKLAETMAHTAKLCPWINPPLGLDVTSLRAAIRRDKQRIEQIGRINARLAKAEESGGIHLQELRDGWCLVTFAEKPDYSIISDLKAAHFYWSRPAWSGKLADLPQSVKDLLGK